MSVDTAVENAQAGWPTPFTWGVAGAGDLTNVGFVRDFSVNVGQAVLFCCSGAGTRIDIFRIGWYGGAGWRKVAQLENVATAQPEAVVIDNSNGATTCTGWQVTSVWQVPEDAASGLYVGVYHNADLSNKTWIPFVIRDDAATADIVYKTSDATWGAAYNYFGKLSAPAGKNLYGSGQGIGNVTDRAYAVSYHRPIITRQGVQQTYFMACEAPMIRFLERQGYTMKYISCLDMDKVFLNSPESIFLSSGHDEYWSANMRNNARVHRDGGGKSIYFSANEVFWKTRYEYRGDEPVMWCYKDTMPGPGSHTAGTPLDPEGWTGSWKDTRWAGRQPEHLLTGTDFRMNGVNDKDAIIPSSFSSHPAWRNTSLNSGPLTLTRVIGFEADSMKPHQPAASTKTLAAYSQSINGIYADDNGQNYNGNGTLNWGIVSQRYEGGGLTVGFGTCQWSWMLDATHDRGTGAEVNQSAQQFTLNLLKDLGAQPQTLMSGMTDSAAVALDEYGVVPQPGTDRGFYSTQGQLDTYYSTNGQLKRLEPQL